MWKLATFIVCGGVLGIAAIFVRGLWAGAEFTREMDEGFEQLNASIRELGETIRRLRQRKA